MAPSSTSSSSTSPERLSALRGVLCVATLALAGSAAAQDAGADRATQNALVARAQAADDACRPSDALPLWQSARDTAPGTRLARLAELRISDLEARSTNGFAPLARLCEIRRDARHLDRSAVLAYAHELDATPPGLVRREGRAVVAESLTALGDAVGAERAWQALAREPGAGADDARRAAEGIAAARRTRGDLRGALRTLDAAGLGQSSAVADLRRERSRRMGRVVAWIAIAVFTVLALVLGVLPAWRRRLALGALGPWHVGIAAWALLGPLLLAAAYDVESFDTFSTFALAGGALLVVSSVAGAGLRGASRGRRALLAGCAVASVLAAGYLVLDRAGALIDLGL